jgi:hypothetical protein
MSDKSILEIFIVPLTIAIIGVYATISTTNTQIKSAETIADTQASRSRLDQLEQKDLDITRAFLDLITSRTKCDNVLDELSFLVQMSTPDHAKKLSSIVKKKCVIDVSRPEVEQLENAVQDARVNEIMGLISELSGENRRNARIELSSQYLKVPETASRLMANAIKENSNSYRILLGILVALANANYKFDKNTDLGKAILSIQNTAVYQDNTLQSWYQKVIRSSS